MTERLRAARAEDGLTLIEVVITVAILGIAFVALLGGMWTSVVASDAHRKQALATTYLINTAEYLKSSTSTPYVACATAADYPLTGVPVDSLPVDWRSNMTLTVKYWNGTVFSAAPGDCFAATTRFKLQQLTLTANSPGDNRARETLSFVKRPG